ncbi:hypothetical protein [Aureliella helgolandensis]|uniref:ABC-2 family transporter protein n=1 Tax=Aureliella helgolandensis TaxID=2527968 RepID=A0A518G401_9BACT|nr:hypothetical protein [Aureliella helgolandensis]QDV23269.1 hypothetical protein Q31a_15670 [Aureliella helgolandensis]
MNIANPTILEIVARPRPSATSALLWKDVQQVRDLTVATIAGLCGLQLVLAAAGLWLVPIHERQGFLGGTFSFPALGPFLAALGCIGMLLGHERQSRSWNWSSSLPISWSASLASKLLVTLTVCLLILLALSIVPASLLATGAIEVQLQAAPDSLQIYSAIYAGGLALLVFFEFLFTCCATVLFFQNTLTGLVVGAIAVTSTHVGLLGASEIFKLRSMDSLVSQGWYNYFLAAAIAVFAGMATLLLYRWRWTTGQTWSFSFGNTVQDEREAGAFFIRTQAFAPTLRRSLLVHALFNSFYLRIFILLGALLLSLLANANSDSTDLGVIAILTIGLLGVTTFEGDQTLERYRFLADRGISPRKLVSSRLLVSGGIALVVLLTLFVFFRIGSAKSNVPVLVFLVPCWIAFGVAALTSLCVRQTIVAITLCAVMLGLGAVVTTTIIQVDGPTSLFLLSRQLVAPAMLGGALCGCIPIIGIYWLARRWLTSDGARLTQHYWWLAGIAVLAPICLACCFSFLGVRNAPWAGMSDAEYAQYQARLAQRPDLELAPPVFDNRLRIRSYSPAASEIHWLASSFRQNSGAPRIQNELHSWLDQTSRYLTQDGTQPLATGLAELATSLEDLEKRLETPTKPQSSQLWSSSKLDELNALLETTAVLGKWACVRGDTELAYRAWEDNLHLQRYASQNLAVATASGRATSMEILATLSDTEIETLGGPDVFAALIPPESNERDAAIETLRLGAEAQRRILRRTPPLGAPTPHDRAEAEQPSLPIQLSGLAPRPLSSYFPPLRWHAERQLAQLVADQLETVRMQIPDYLTHASRSPLVLKLYNLKQAQEHSDMPIQSELPAE